MAGGYIESKGAVTSFLTELKTILNSPYLIFELMLREDKAEEYTTKYCLRTLNFDKKDVIKELKNLTIKNYVETLDDERNKKSNRYYVFSKKINNYEIYIKIKIRSYENKNVLCMSFHFAEYTISKFPY